ncbi:MAG: hypothetical protein V1793_11840 [Pseudomonadota bacterium]
MNNRYTCNEYREEMMLMGLHRRLETGDLTETQRQEILAEIRKIERSMGFDQEGR